MISIRNVFFESEVGEFYGRGGDIGWRSNCGSVDVSYPADSIVQAEWFEGAFKILCETETASELLQFDGFDQCYFATLSRYFREVCNVKIKKHRAILCFDEEEEFDQLLHLVEEKVDKVNECKPHSVKKKVREPELMNAVGALRNWMEKAIRGDKYLLSQVFSAGDCERLGRLHLIVDRSELEIYDTDSRWVHLQTQIETIERVLRELNTFCPWVCPNPSNGGGNLSARPMLYERIRQEWMDDEEETGSTFEGGAYPGYVDADDILILETDPYDEEADEEGVGHGAACMAGGGMMSWGSQNGYLKVIAEAEGGDLSPSTIGAGSVVGCGGDRGQVVAGADGCEVLPGTTLTAFLGGIPPMPGKDGAAPQGAQDPSCTWICTPESIYEGWVWKRSKYLRRWKRRWLVLRPESLDSFRKKNRKPTITVAHGGIFDVYDADSEIRKDTSLCIMGYKQKYYITCDNTMQREIWQKEITRLLGSARGAA